MRPKLQCGHTRLQDHCGPCQALQTQWYERLKTEGFQDAENPENTEKVFGAWTSVSMRVEVSGYDEPVDIIDLVISQNPHAPFQNTFIENPVEAKERLFHHPDFDRLCENLCGHWNHTGTPHQVSAIWQAYIQGDSNRAIAAALGLNDTFVWRTIKALTEWMELMDLDAEAPQSLAKVVLRDFAPKQDEPFIYASWRNALWYDDENRKEGDADRFYRQATKSIRTILENPGTKIRIACLSDSPDFIVGYSVISGICLHFVYVKADYRGKRIGSILVPRMVETVSPVMTKIGKAIALKRGYTKKNQENENGKAERVKE